MLDNTTRKRIDDCRDILVGKLPDPKSQIEQITIALIYKFMDDMDNESIDLGGEAKFFSDDFEKYSWDSLFDAKVTATEMLKLYSESIESMEKNPNIPQLFRNIFKNAYLPYRDPETLKLFLKTIGEFEYTHSEKLGDAFEYLLSVMGSQGDAGQFRTPRHIIDFLVAAVDPSKTDTILDPACGTAGFLISAFKRIKEKNNNQLTPDERTKLIKNFIGYDISPDMVRLSLVNLYLHGFSDPHIFEYDTLTSEDRWNDSFDVVLANPPFMSPKGGIRPHKKFTVTSNRSEVLFVDYIAEHLNPNGRAGIIVPEGVIFQSGKAYKELRKMLVENYLYAVVSLPAGVFNPYSGVKTSILLIDKSIAKKTNKILFVKIDNDGYNLGAQRNVIKGGQLKEAIEILKQFKANILSGDRPLSEVEMAHAVEKSKIAENGEFNLGGERYKINESLAQSSYPLVKVDDLCDLVRGSSPRPKGDPLYYGGQIPRLMISDITRDGMYTTPTTDSLTEEGAKKSRPMKKGEVIMAVSGNPGLSTILSLDACIHDGFVGFRNLDKRILPEFFYFVLVNQKDINNSHSIGAVFKNLTTNQIRQFQTPLPSLFIQEEIVAEIEGYQKIIDGAKMVVDNYKPQIDIDADWEMVELGKVCEVNPKKSELKSLPEELEVSFVPMADLNENQIIFKPLQTKYLSEVIKGYTYFKEDDVLLAKVTPCFENGKAGIAKNLVNKIGFGSSEYYVFRPNETILSSWIYLNIITNGFREKGKLNMTGTGGLQRVPRDFILTSLIPLPPIATQHQIITKIEKEQELVDSSKQLIEIFEQKIKNRIAKVWGE